MTSKRETVEREFAKYIVDEINPSAFTVSYTLIKNGKLWGTFHHVVKGSDLLWIEKGTWRMGLNVFKDRETIEKIINANEKRLTKKAGSGSAGYGEIVEKYDV